MPVQPTMPNGLGGSSVVMTNLEPACANTTTVATLVGGVGTYKFQKGSQSQVVALVPPAGIDTLDIDVRVQPLCNDQWVVVAFVEIPTINSTTPAIPPAACPCWERTTNGTCPGIKVPITLTTLDAAEGMSLMQCIDPANFDPYTGRMAYSYCWRYSCLPDVFATSRFKATTPNLERWNIRLMSGSYRLRMQRTEGVYITVTGHPKNATVPNPVYKETDDETDITLPPGGVGNFTFEYIIPPGFDDLSAAVVMDSGPRPPPPPAPPGAAYTSCRCPLKPEETISGSATKCNETYATMVVTLEEDSRFTALQCVPWPNYDIFMKEMAFSHCWKYECLPEGFKGKPYFMSITNVTKHNIQLIPAAGYELIMFPAPYGMAINVTLNPVEGDPATYYSTNGSKVVNGRLQVVPVPPPGLTSLTISLYIPAIYGLDGMSAAVVLRYLTGTQPPSPPLPPSPPPAPPSPPPLPAGAARTVITTDFMVTARIPVEQLLGLTVAGGTATFSGYYVTIPIQYYTYEALPDCSDSAKAAFQQSVAKLLNVADPSTITVACRYATPTSNTDTLSRRLMRMLSLSALVPGDGGNGDIGDGGRPRERLLAAADPVLSVTVTSPTSVNPSEAATSFCTTIQGTASSGVGCDPGVFTSSTRLTVSTEVAGTVSDTGSACSSASAQSSAALRASLGLSSADLQPVSCDTKVVTSSSSSTSSPSGGGTSRDVAAAPPPPPPPGTGTPTTSAPVDAAAAPDGGAGVPAPGAAATTTPSPSSGGGGSDVPIGAIVGSVVGGLALMALVAVVAVTVRRRMRGNLVHINTAGGTAAPPPPGGLRGRVGGRWRTTSMEVRAQQARSGRGPVAGVTNYA